MQLREKEAIRWVTDRDGSIGWRDDGRVEVEVKGTRGTGPCILRAMKDWQKQRRRSDERGKRSLLS